MSKALGSNISLMAANDNSLVALHIFAGKWKKRCPAWLKAQCKTKTKVGSVHNLGRLQIMHTYLP